MRINDLDFTIGADPELFISKDGVPHSAYGLIKGDKVNPEPVPFGAVQVDGMALEFNIDPASSKEQFLHHLTEVQKTILGMVPGFDLIDAQSVIFEMEHFYRQPRKARDLGCEPDFNGATGSVNPRPRPEIESMRTVGGHVHIGGFYSENIFEDQHFNACCSLARYMDEELGVYSVLWDHDDKRRSMYGKASCFRPKKYGMEYRTMSNKWIFKPQLIEIVYDFTVDAIKRMFDPTPFRDDVAEIINTSDRGSSFFRRNEKADRVMEAIA